MASIQRVVSSLTGGVSYRAQVRVKGHEPQGKTFPNKKEAAAWAGSIESAIREARYFPNQKASRTPFAEVVARYRGTALTNLKASGAGTREQHLDWWVERFAGKTLSEITPDLVAEARNELASSTYTRGKPRQSKDGRVLPPKQYSRSGATTNRYLATLSHLFTIASKEWRLTDRNPVRDIAKKKKRAGGCGFSLMRNERGCLMPARTHSGDRLQLWSHWLSVPEPGVAN